MTTAFELGMRWVLKAEGGYYPGNEPRDPNPTNYGITQATFDRYRRALKPSQPKIAVRKITMDETYSIYRICYWTKGKCDIISEKSETLAVIHFDACVNHGVASPNNDKSAGAIELLQRTIGVTDDGVWGPITAQTLWSELSAPGEVSVASRYLKVREAQYRHLAQHAPNTLGLNLPAWLARLDKLRDFLALP